MTRKHQEMSAGKKAHHTAKWARTMTKWLITYSRHTGAKWNLVEFGGRTRSEARGIVDLIAIRKDHRRDGPGLKRGDLFEIVLIQTKGGSAPRPKPDDVARLRKVAKLHNSQGDRNHSCRVEARRAPRPVQALRVALGLSVTR